MLDKGRREFLFNGQKRHTEAPNKVLNLEEGKGWV